MLIYWSVVGIFCSLKQECMILNPPTDGTKLDLNIGGGFKKKYPYLGKWSNFNYVYFQMGWWTNHQLL